MVKSVRNPLLGLAVILLLTSCSGSDHSTGSYKNNTSTANEQLLLKVKNYSGLIKMKREELKKSNNNKVRYDLANYYYLSQDYRSSMFYLKPLLSTGASSEVYLLQAKNLSELGEYKKSLSFIDIALSKTPNNAEALNVKGVIQAQMGDS